MFWKKAILDIDNCKITNFFHQKSIKMIFKSNYIYGEKKNVRRNFYERN